MAEAAYDLLVHHDHHVASTPHELDPVRRSVTASMASPVPPPPCPPAMPQPHWQAKAQVAGSAQVALSPPLLYMKAVIGILSTLLIMMVAFNVHMCFTMRDMSARLDEVSAVASTSAYKVARLDDTFTTLNASMNASDTKLTSAILETMESVITLQEFAKETQERLTDAKSGIANVKASTEALKSDVRVLSVISSDWGLRSAAIDRLFPALHDFNSSTLLGLGIPHQVSLDAARVVASAVGRSDAAGAPVPNLHQSTLLYSMSRDGPTAAAWHAAVDGVPRMLTLARVGDNWFGGYTAVGFGGVSETNHTSDPDAFIFTLVNPHSIPPSVYRVKGGQEKDALYLDATRGPCFGGGICIHAPFDSNTKSDFRFPFNYVESLLGPTGMGLDTFHTQGEVGTDRLGTYRSGWTVSDMYSFKL